MNRRLFIASVISASALAQMSFKRKRKLCFSTLGCPDWDWLKILTEAEKFGFEGIEIRGLQDEIDILKSPVFSKSNRKASKRLAEDHGVKIVNLNPSANLHETDTAKRKANIDEAKRYIDLAAELNTPFVRVFPDKFAFKDNKQKSLDLISQGLHELSEYCKGTGVKTLLDSHGDLVWSEDIKGVLTKQDRNTTGLIWDYFNMHLQTKEFVSVMVKNVSPFIDFVQIKDGLFLENETYKYELPGNGEVPVSAILKELDQINYEGFISLEWEKRWHPDLPDLELALPLFKKMMKS